MPEPSLTVDGVAVTYPSGEPQPAPTDLTSVLRDVIASVEEADYLAVLAFVPDDETYTRALQKALDRVSRKTGRAVALGIGPRYLHSTGQLHKGGPNKGVFVVVSAQPSASVPVPGEDYALADLVKAQADGDMMTLAAHDRRVVGLRLPDARGASLKTLADAFSQAVT